MTKFSNDSDILKYEPILFDELHFPAQVIAQGVGGVVSGTAFTAAGADFLNSGVSAGGVIYLHTADEKLNAPYEIVSVNSATTLTISVIRADDGAPPIPPPSSNDVFYRISTFAPQANIAAFALTEYFGIAPGYPASEIAVSDIFDSTVLRQASVFWVIAAVYATLADKDNSEHFWTKSEHYKKSFRDARSRARLSIDKGSDGTIESTSLGGSVRLVRD